MRKLLLISTILAAGALPLSIAQAQTSTGQSDRGTQGTIIDKSDATKPDNAGVPNTPSRKDDTVRRDSTDLSGKDDSKMTDRPATADRGHDWDKANALDMTSVDDLIGRDVVNLRGETVGEVNDVVMAPTGEGAYAVLEVGGFLGIGEKLVAVPMDQLRVDRGDSDEVILLSQMSEDELEDMPAYDKAMYRAYDPDKIRKAQ